MKHFIVVQDPLRESVTYVPYPYALVKPFTEDHRHLTSRQCANAVEPNFALHVCNDDAPGRLAEDESDEEEGGEDDEDEPGAGTDEKAPAAAPAARSTPALVEPKGKRPPAAAGVDGKTDSRAVGCSGGQGAGRQEQGRQKGRQHVKGR